MIVTEVETCYKKRHEGESSKDKEAQNWRTWRLKTLCTDLKYGKG